MRTGSATNPLDRMLEQMRRCFYVRTAAIRLEHDGAPIEIHAGAPTPWSDDVSASRLQRLAAQQRVIVPDVDLEAVSRPMEIDRPRVRFLAGIPLSSETGRRFGTLCLLHSHPRWLDAAQLAAFDDLAAQLAPLAERRLDVLSIARLRQRIESQSVTIRRQAQELALGRSTFERAAAAARLGIWECALTDDSLTWTDQVYDLFDVPRGSRLFRDKTLDCYRGASRELLESTRNAAIADRRGFQIDAEIVTLKGSTRWIRISAEVDCRGGVPIRLLGMKQDITEQKLLLDRTRHLAEVDVMTGLANRARFQSRLAELCADGTGRSRIGALLLVDLDRFKQVNDGFGHAVGDACLQEAARRLAAVCGRTDLIARIGGDEFAVLVGDGHDGSEIEALARAVVEAMRRPMREGAHVFRIGASIGIADAVPSLPPTDLFGRADAALYAAKTAGRGTFRRFDAATALPAQARMPGSAAAEAGTTQGSL